VGLTNPDTGNATVKNGWTFTGVLNETDSGAEADFCALVFPLTTTASVNTASEAIYGQIFEAGLTDTTVGGKAPGILAELGYGALGTDPTTTTGWRFVVASFNGEAGLNNSNDEYWATLTIGTANQYAYAYRFSFDSGLNFTYCDQGSGDGGSGSNAGLLFEPSSLGTITVQ
jgi:hypothetical protein